jgi:predicted PurR-regulated permease PerM
MDQDLEEPSRPASAPAGPVVDGPRRDPARTIAHVLRATAILVGVAALLWVMADAFLIIFLATLLSAMLRGLGRGLHRVTRLNMTISVLLVFVLLAAALCGASWWIGPKLAAEAKQLWSQISGQLNGLRPTLRGLGLGQLVGGSSGEVPHMVALVATSTLAFIGAVLVIAATAVYFAIAPELYIEGVVHLVPRWYQERARSILLEMGAAMQGWLLGQLIDMIVVGVLVGGGLALLGTPLALVLGVIAGLFTFVPYFGTIASAVPALLVGLTGGLRATLWILLLFLLAHGVEGYLVSPFVQRRTVHLPPALTVLAMVMLTAVFGISGVLIATPLVAVLIVGITRVYVEDVLGDYVAGNKVTLRGQWYWFNPPE